MIGSVAAWLRTPFVQRLGLAFLSGALVMWGLPPEPNPVVAVAGLALWLRLVDGNGSVRGGAWLGWMFGLGHFIPGLSWLWSSLHTYGKLPGAVAVLLIVALAAILALYPALCGFLLPRLAPRIGLLPLAAPAVWVVSEWLRAHLLSGFPWNLMGHVWDGTEGILQLADLGGVYLLSGLTLFLAALLAWMTHPQVRVRRGLVAVAVLSIVAVAGAGTFYGQWRLQQLESRLAVAMASRAPLRVALVQGNIAQDLKWVKSLQKEWLQRYLDLTVAIDQPVDLVIWPETAAAFFLQVAPVELERIAALSSRLRTPILTGAPMADRDAKREWQFYNSMVLIDREERGEFRHRYDKHHLVPFGEYIPLRFLAPDSLHKLTHGAQDFLPGPGPMAVDWGLGVFGPLICYEVIFPDEVRQMAMQGARWLINLTNDGWFGEAAKPQHLAMERMRAVENRLPMIRVANSGISAVFDPLGRELVRMPSNVQGSVAVAVPEGIEMTLWSRYGGWMIAVWPGLGLLSWLLARRNIQTSA